MAIIYRGGKQFGFSFKWQQPAVLYDNYSQFDASGTVSHLLAHKVYDDYDAMQWMKLHAKFKRVESPKHEDIFEFDNENDAAAFRLIWL